MSRLTNGFKDPVKRPRFIIWTATIVLFLIVFIIVALGVTSTYWFCSGICHTVQDDSISQYNRSTHSRVSCMSCHEPLNANPVTFVLAKAEALGELYLTATGKYELPLNKAFGNDHLAMTGMPSEMCTQCHALENRKITPSAGIIIDHKAHSDAGIRCTWCHNRVAHNDTDYTYVNKDPKTGEVPTPQPNDMKMTSCFRCHSLEAGAKVPGACATCHPADFQLKPASHLTDAFKGQHGKMALAEVSRVASVTAELKDHEIEEGGHGGAGEGDDYPMPEKSASEINYCSTCHSEKFCSDCHGLEMPHPAEFKKGHGDASRAQAEKCIMCHGVQEETKFCASCHHGSAIGWTFDKTAAWGVQHGPAAGKVGVKSCLGACHETKFCLDCHTSTKALPASHSAADWTKPATPAMTVYGKTPAKATAQHTAAANASADTCAICHGDGGIGAAFCVGCHQTELPHNAEFKKFHSATGKANAAACANCHGFKELCSNCHHVGASLTVAWKIQHGAAVAENGSTTCLKGCHKQEDCVSCHQSSKAIPASHETATFVRNFAGAADHTTQFKANAGTCVFCHSGEAATLASTDFCQGCHQLAMPHASGGGAQKFAHAAELKAGTYTKAQCQGCHQQSMCDSCHHTQSDGTTPWLVQHRAVAQSAGATACFKCHEPTYCAACHVQVGKSKN